MKWILAASCRFPSVPTPTPVHVPIDPQLYSRNNPKKIPDRGKSGGILPTKLRQAVGQAARQVKNERRRRRQQREVIKRQRVFPTRAIR